MLTPLRWVPFVRADIAFCMSLESLKLLEVGLDSYLKNPLLLILTFVRPLNHLS